MKKIQNIAKSLGLSIKNIIPYGNYMSKINVDSKLMSKKQKGKLILVTSVNPTPKGEGKTTVAIGLSQALHSWFTKSIVCLREPSLGPIFGSKGTATGGGKTTVEPSTDINLHFTGDMHAITSAHNLIASVIDNHISNGNELDLDIDNITWKRTLDINDASLRNIIVSGAKHSRASSFQITAASELMSIICLLRHNESTKIMQQLIQDIDNIIIGIDLKGRNITIKELGISHSVAVLLKDAIKPNLVQTSTGSPAIIHGGHLQILHMGVVR